MPVDISTSIYQCNMDDRRAVPGGSAIERARDEGILAVEMEAAALYTFANERDLPVVCFTYVTNEMGQGEGEFEKGKENGSTAALEIVLAAIEAWREWNEEN